MHGGYVMRVREQVPGIAGLVHDHADAAGVLDRQALVDTSIDAALAENDLAGHQRWLEESGRRAGALAEVVAVRGCCRGIDQADHRGAIRDGRAGEARSVAEVDGALQEAALSTGRHSDEPRVIARTADSAVARARPAIADRSGDKDASIVGTQEGDV